MANVTTTVITQPTILVGGVAQTDKITGEHTSIVTVQAPVSTASPASITFTADAGATIRYTLGGKNPTLGSPVFTAGTPVVIRQNGNGFSSDNTIIKAKAFLNGDPSTIAVVELVIT